MAKNNVSTISRNEIILLQTQGLIDEQTAQNLESFINDKEIANSSKKGNTTVTLFSIIGALLVGAGIIVLTSKNWYYLPTSLKVLISVIPLLISQFGLYYVVKNDIEHIGIREGLSVFASAAIFTALALISRIYHLPNDTGIFLLQAGLLTLPFAYILNTITPIPIYLACMFFGYGFEYAESYQKLYLTLTLILGIPYFAMKLREDYTGKGLAFLGVLSAISTCAYVGVVASNPFVLIPLAVVFIAIGSLLGENETNYFSPFSVIGKIVGLFSLYLYSFSFNEHMNWEKVFFEVFNEMSVIALTNIATILLAVIAAGLVIWKYRDIGLKVLTGGLLLFVFLIIGEKVSPVVGLLCNILLLVEGGLAIYESMKAYSLRNANYGMSLAVLIILTRFFDSEISIVMKGLAFIIAGCVFIWINVHISRNRRLSK